jgi:uncharacterized membrane protein YuzA (DUF378 family)
MLQRKGIFMKRIDEISFWLVAFGGITWGIWGIFQWNVIDYFLDQTRLDFVLYLLIGVSSLYLIFRKAGNCCCCRKKGD